MVELHWPRNTIFTDRENEERYDGPGTFEVPEESVDHYLDRGWERIDEDSESADTDADDEAETEESPAGADEEPELADVDVDTDTEHSREELEEMSYDELRTLASESDRDDVNGRSGKQAIIDAFASDEED